ncbi:class F sortase [Luteimicrobium subarcticum]|uniref:class F sortase n=1 Tax=Luteimicrobium subarcticum TaxID=620910 RepID=UPI000C24515D|nr:class F sortase [Luteimicrobium subarcticum]
MPAGVAADGTLQIPASGQVAGWYRYGPAPASRAGSAVLASHVDTLQGIGQFARLQDVRRGARVDVRDASGATAHYAVRSVLLVAKSRLPLDQIFDETGPRRLVLMTCGGTWDASTGHYRDNVVLVATPVS